MADMIIQNKCPKVKKKKSLTKSPDEKHIQTYKQQKSTFKKRLQHTATLSSTFPELVQKILRNLTLVFLLFYLIKIEGTCTTADGGMHSEKRKKKKR